MQRADEGQKCELQRQLPSKRSFISSTYCLLLAFWGAFTKRRLSFFPPHGRLFWVGKASYLSGLLGWVRKISNNSRFFIKRCLMDIPNISEYAFLCASVSGERNELSDSMGWNEM